MGFRVEIGRWSFEAIDYSVTEAASPLDGGDSSGQVGQFSVTLPKPDKDAFPALSRQTGWTLLRDFGPSYFHGHEIRIFDSRKGFTLGIIDSASLSKDGGTYQFSGVSRLGLLNVYGIQAEPFTGTLDAAFAYYMSLANITSDFQVDASIASRQVVFPGWNGELWYNLKLLTQAMDCDISLVSGVILLRPVRARVGSEHRQTGQEVTFNTANLAQFVEVYQYNNEPVVGGLVYPPGGWTPDVQVMNVNAGETEEYTLEMSASLTSFQQPVMQTFVAENHSTSSVYTIVANDGRPVPPDQWRGFGGSLEVTLDPDTTRLRVKLTGAVNLPTQTGGFATNFSVALGSDTTGNRYSTFRIVGTGVAFNKELVRIPTGVSERQTATEVGATIDNPFLSSRDDVYRVGIRAARNFAGSIPRLSGSVYSLNRRGDTGAVQYITYEEVREKLDVALGDPDYDQVQNYMNSLGINTYLEDIEYWRRGDAGSDKNQVFGNAQGVRIYDSDSRYWFRVREASLDPAGINLSSADADLLHSDVQALRSGMTYAQERALWPGQVTHLQVELAGLYNG